jgi:ABC-type phosphate transport system auxiliary subunit
MEQDDRDAKLERIREQKRSMDRVMDKYATAMMALAESERADRYEAANKELKAALRKIHNMAWNAIEFADEIQASEIYDITDPFFPEDLK